MKSIERVHIASHIAMSYLGKPYIWGGDDPVKGFDCSGFVIEILKSVGVLPIKGDWTSQELLEYFEHKKLVDHIQVGCLLFFGKEKANHVEYALNAELSIGASGGGQNTTTIEDAIRDNAFIKIRPIISRKNLLSIVYPFLER